jgi:hypothetical protein
MTSLFKKSGGKAEPIRVLAWHPNFRNTEQLPDTKTVRTKFFVNAIAVAVAASFALFVIIRETNLAALRSELFSVEAEIEKNRKPSEKAVADFKIYEDEEKRFTSASNLVVSRFSFSDFLTHLAKIMPTGVKLSRVDFRGTGEVVNLSGSVVGLDASASDIASSYIKILQADPAITEHFSGITLTNLGRNVTEGNMNFDIVLAFKKAPAPGGKK